MTCSTCLRTTGLLLMLLAGAARAEEETPPKAPPPAAKSPATLAEAKLASRDIIERLKTIRSDIVLEEELIRFYKVKLERLSLEGRINEAEGRPVPQAAVANSPKKSRASASAMTGLPPTPSNNEVPSEMLVKAVTTKPFKEAIVTYRGRVYTVRPGDKLGPYEIKDINESGVITSGEGAARSVLMGR